jgi:phosphomannomutase / phosphoglucomutase
MMNPQVFREYDIRGVVDKDLDDEFVSRLAIALGAYWTDHGVKKVVVGMDARLSSPRFKDIMIKNITASGIDVIDIGLVPTPVMYFALFRLNLDGGVAITGSHNPPDNNGFKIALGKTTIYGSEIQNLKAYVEKGTKVTGKGVASSYDLIPEYIEDILSRIATCPNMLKVVLDPGNGAGGRPAMMVLERLGMDVTGICLEPDGNFPNHHPDPTIAEGVEMLKRKVLETGADIGIGLDGDADRIGVIDAAGNVVYGDMITAILAEAILKDKPGEKIIGEVKCSKVLFDRIQASNGIPIMGKVGHSLMKARLKEENAALAGEMSGHIFFKDRWYGFDDGIYAAARLIEVLSNSVDAQAVFDGLPKMHNTPEIRFLCPDEIKFKAVDEFTCYAKAKYPSCIDIDGVRFEDKSGWGLARPSNTQPVIVLRFEADTKGHLDELETDTRAKLDEIIKGLKR